MEYILIFIVSALVGFLVGWIWYRLKINEMKKKLERTQKEVEKEREEFGGLAEVNKRLIEIKEGRKRKILEEMRRGGKMHTDRVADLLLVSRTSAFRYLEELEKEGAIEQVGAFGKDVEYKIRQK